MAQKAHVEVVLQGKSALSKWRQQNPDTVLDLVEAKLSDINLRGANLSEARLSHADLRDADLSAVILRNGVALPTKLIQVELRGADLRGANLFRASFAHAVLIGVDLRDANLVGVRFSAVLKNGTCPMSPALCARPVSLLRRHTVKIPGA